MKTYITATFENGDTIKTEIKATPREATAYYYGKVFNLGAEEDNLQRCVSVITSPEPSSNCTFEDSLNQAKNAAGKLARV